MFQSIDLTSKALDALSLRQEVISHNLSNIDTPNYKRQEVEFESILEKELEKNNVSDINLNKINPKIVSDLESYSYRMDGNNVDLDREITELTKNELRYNTLLERTNAQISRYKYILQNLK